MTAAVLLAAGCVLLTLALAAWLRRRLRVAPIDDQPSEKPLRGDEYLWALELRRKESR